MTTVSETSAPEEHPLLPAGAATDRLAAYRPGADRFFASPTRTLLARGVHTAVAHDERPLAVRVGEALGRAVREGHEPVVVGALPFDPAAPAALAVPLALDRAGALAADPLTALPAPAATAGDWQVRPVPEPGRYREAVTDAVRRMAAGDFRKVVLARTLELTGPQPPDVPGMLQRLARRDSRGYVFATPSVADGTTLLGASPELLVSRTGDCVVTNPLAGSVPRSADLAEDVNRASELLKSPKDLHEHAVVVDAIRAALDPYCSELTVPERPTLVRTAAMWHLASTLTGRLREPAPSALDLALALHPTPAVCGEPAGPARGAITELEPFDRGLYSGVVGWGNADGDGEWVVTIRCAEVSATGMRLYAGAGIVASSDPDAETAETGAKFRTFLDAVGQGL